MIQPFKNAQTGTIDGNHPGYMINSPYHQFAIWLAENSKPIRNEPCPFSLQNTFQFAEQIKHLYAAKRLVISLDEASPFANRPLVETTDYTCDHIENTDPNVGVSTDLFKELLLPFINSIYIQQFKFNNRICKQRDGVANGSNCNGLSKRVSHRQKNLNRIYWH